MKVLVTKLKGIHCGSCINTIERISLSKGAIKADIDLKTLVGKFYYEEMNEQAVIESIEDRGYQVEKLTTYDEEDL
ncbi:MAG: heavy-metal-associated domain-containing protein [Acholeplasma sp.]|jgi:copper chaperone CopZ|nr:heavy-metal-associated domain-containing protein [Acholeplasma sp.]